MTLALTAFSNDPMTNAGHVRSSVQLATDKVLVLVSNDPIVGQEKMYLYTVDTSGSTPSAGALFTLEDADQQYSQGDLVGYSTTLAAIAYYNDNTLGNSARQINISGTSISSVSSALTLDSSTASQFAQDALTSSKAICINNRGTGSAVEASHITDGAPPTESSRLTLDSSGMLETLPAVVALSSSRAIAVWQDSAGDLNTSLINTSGANPTLTDGPDLVKAGGYFYNVWKSAQKRSGKLSSTTAVFGYGIDGKGAGLVVIENNSDVINIGTALEFDFPSPGNFYSLAVTGGASGEFVAVGNDRIIRRFTVSGTTLTDEADEVAIPSTAMLENGNVSLCATGDSGKVLVLSGLYDPTLNNYDIKMAHLNIT